MYTKITRLLLLVACVCTIVSCGDDEPITPTIDLPHSVIGTAAVPYAQRKEVPAIKDHSMYVVHYTDAYGVTYSLEWDQAQKTQRWAAYAINKINNSKNFKRAGWKGTIWKGRYWTADPFQEDSILPRDVRTTLADHASNGYDRGHIVNSNDRLVSQNANGQTFYLSNIQPQLSGFNGSANGGGIWLNFENKVNGWGQSLKAGETLYIVKGGTTQKTAKVPNPFIADSKSSIPVPRYFFMAILKQDAQGNYQAIAFWAEHKFNQDKNIKNYTISIDELEERTGINFYPNIDTAIEKTVEAQCKPADWGL